MIGPDRQRHRTKADPLRADAHWAEKAGFATTLVPQIPEEFDALTGACVVPIDENRDELLASSQRRRADLASLHRT